MDLFELIKVIFRRWKVVVPIGLLTLGVAYYVHTTTPPEYEAAGWLRIAQAEAVSANPVSELDLVSLSKTLSIGADSNFVVTPVSEQSYNVAAAAPTGESAEAVVEAVITGLQETTAAMQAEDATPDEDRIELRMATPDVVAQPQSDGSYLAQASVFLYDPVLRTPNPYLPDGSTGRLLQVAASGDASRQHFRELSGAEVSYSVFQEDSADPLLQVVTTGPDRDQVLAAFRDVQTVLSEDLQSWQDEAGVREEYQVTLEVLDAPLGVTDQSPPVTRATAGIIALGGLLTFGIAVGLEGLSKRRDPHSQSSRESSKSTDGADANRSNTPGGYQERTSNSGKTPSRHAMSQAGDRLRAAHAGTRAETEGMANKTEDESAEEPETRAILLPDGTLATGRQSAHKP